MGQKGPKRAKRGLKKAIKGPKRAKKGQKGPKRAINYLESRERISLQKFLRIRRHHLRPRGDGIEFHTAIHKRFYILLLHSRPRKSKGCGRIGLFLPQPSSCIQ